MAGCFLGFALWEVTGSPLGYRSWAAFLLFALGTTVGLVVVGFLGILIVHGLRRWRLQGERYPLVLARKCARQEGEVVKEGPTTIWYSGQADPGPMIQAERARSRGRWESLLGGNVEVPSKLRILCFHQRKAFLHFHRRLFPALNLASMDGMYVIRPHRILTLCTDVAPCRVSQPEKTVRSLAVRSLLEALQGSIMAPLAGERDLQLVGVWRRP
jgi:hypothetical protein